ncbi:MAG TPA: hypothetical protein VF120_15310, partial [Ktedonobacterales bacterium]
MNDEPQPDVDQPLGQPFDQPDVDQPLDQPGQAAAPKKTPLLQLSQAGEEISNPDASGLGRERSAVLVSERGA